FLFFAFGCLYSKIVNVGGSIEPLLTANSPPIPSFSISFLFKTFAVTFLIPAARFLKLSAIISDVISCTGVLTKSLAKNTLSTIIDNSSKSFFTNEEITFKFSTLLIKLFFSLKYLKNLYDE